MPSIEARITKVEKNEHGWFLITVDHPEIKRLDTKIEEKAREALALLNQPVLIDYTEKQGGRNEHTGGYYMNRYYEQAGSLPEPTPAAGAQPEIPLAPVASRRTAPEDAWRMTLAAAAKIAVESLPHMKPDQRELVHQRQIALSWAEWLFTTPAPVNEADGIPF